VCQTAISQSTAGSAFVYIKATPNPFIRSLRVVMILSRALGKMDQPNPGIPPPTR
jgi:hypothetical protein